jgi:cardiolipin-specific phospholipase
MGSSPSAELQSAEDALLTFGRDWWKTARGSAAALPPAFDVIDVPIPGERSVHTLHRAAPPPGQDALTSANRPPLVLLHGFGSGAAMFYGALPALSEAYPGDVYAVDMLGCGLSSRPRGDEDPACAPDAQPESVEQFWADALEAWRVQLGLTKIVVCGHSMGGYAAVCYAERHPGACDRIVLASPVGLPLQPPGSEERLRERTAAMPFFRRFLFSAAVSAWEGGTTPFALAAVPGGKALLDSLYVKRRFPDAAWVPKPLILDYLHANWANGACSAGGHAHATLLRPGAWAKRPLAPRLERLDVAVRFVYGATDWMDANHARKVLRRRSGAGAEARLWIVDGAGHQLYVDQPAAFAEAVLAACAGSARAPGRPAGPGIEVRVGARSARRRFGLVPAGKRKRGADADETRPPASTKARM